MAAIIEIEGVGEAYAAKLKSMGVTTTAKLLKMGATPQGRKDLMEKSGIRDELLLKWINHADLMRIKGVGAEYSELLEAAGVDTVPELAQRNAENLVAKMQEVNAAKKIVRHLPVLSQVMTWVSQAKALPRMISY